MATIRLTLLLLFFLPIPATAGSLIQGTVLDARSGAPLRDVQIDVELSGKRQTPPVQTGADGRYALDLSKMVFTPVDLKTDVVNISFSKEGYRPATRIIRGKISELVMPDNGVIKMQLVAGATVLSPEEAAQLKSLRSATGRTLFVVPYMIQQSGLDADRFNGDLRSHLKRGINTHLQAIGAQAALGEVAIEPLSLKLESAGTDKGRAVGMELNALAVIGGRIFGQETDERAPLEVTSEFAIIPVAGPFLPWTLFVDDRLPRNMLQSSGLYKRLNKIWGGNTVLALSVLEVRQAIEKNDRLGLHRARGYLLAEKKEAGPEDASLVQQIDALLGFIESQLKK
jgi:hypothetical protein